MLMHHHRLPGRRSVVAAFRSAAAVDRLPIDRTPARRTAVAHWTATPHWTRVGHRTSVALPMFVMTRRHPVDARRHITMRGYDPAAVIVMRAEPNVATTAPIPAAGEEDFFVVVLDDHDARAHGDERRRDLEVNG